MAAPNKRDKKYERRVEDEYDDDQRYKDDRNQDPYEGYKNDDEYDDDDDRNVNREDAASHHTPRQQPAKLKDAELQEYSDLLGIQMAQEKLREAQKIYDADLLAQALEEWDALELKSDEFYLRARELHYAIEKHRKLLREARHMKKPDSRLIEDRLTMVKKMRLELYMRDEVEKCQQLLIKLNVKERKTAILAMDKKTMSEMKSYTKPSPMVHRIMTSALLLLAEDEETTAAWKKVQALCNPDGRDGMVRKVMNFDPREVHPEIIKRVRYLLKDINLAQAQKASPGAGTFYVWAKRVIGEEPEENESASRAESKTRDADEEKRGSQGSEPDFDDSVSILEEDDSYERLKKEAEAREADHQHYIKTLPLWINKEKRIFAEQKRNKEEQKRSVVVSQRGRPTDRPAARQAESTDSYRSDRSPARSKNMRQVL